MMGKAPRLSRVKASVLIREVTSCIVFFSLLFLKARLPEEVQFSWHIFFIFAGFQLLVLLSHRLYLIHHMNQSHAIYISVFLDTILSLMVIWMTGLLSSPFLVLLPLLVSMWAIIAITPRYSIISTFLSFFFLFLAGHFAYHAPLLKSLIYSFGVASVMLIGTAGLYPFVEAFEKRSRLLKQRLQKVSSEKVELEKYAEEVLDLTSRVEYEKEVFEKELKQFKILFDLLKGLRSLNEVAERSIVKFFVKTMCDKTSALAGIGRCSLKTIGETFDVSSGNSERVQRLKEILEKSENCLQEEDLICVKTSLGDGDYLQAAFAFTSPFYAELYSSTLEQGLKFAATELLRLKYTRSLERLSVTDELTGLYNHRYFYNRLEEEVLRCSRINVPLSLIMIDFDRFKSINDRYGHLVGDEFLKKSAEKMKKICRKTDILCRYGGEEFAVILPGTSIEGAVVLSEKIRKAFEKPFVEFPEKPVVTVSIGVSTLHTGEKDIRLLVKRSDDALLLAKEKGRNRVEVHP